MAGDPRDIQPWYRTDLPAWIYNYLLGTDTWPQGSESQSRDTARKFADMLGLMSSASASGNQGAQKVNGSVISAMSKPEFDRFWASYVDKGGSIPAAQQQYREAIGASLEYADSIEYGKWSFNIQVTFAIVEWLTAIAFAILTRGVSLGEFVAIKMPLRRALITAIRNEVIEEIFFSATPELVTQAITKTGSDGNLNLGDWDWRAIGQNAFAGALGGVFGGLSEWGITKLANFNPGTFGRTLADFAGTLPGQMVNMTAVNTLAGVGTWATFDFGDMQKFGDPWDYLRNGIFTGAAYSIPGLISKRRSYVNIPSTNLSAWVRKDGPLVVYNEHGLAVGTGKTTPQGLQITYNTAAQVFQGMPATETIPLGNQTLYGTRNGAVQQFTVNGKGGLDLKYETRVANGFTPVRTPNGWTLPPAGSTFVYDGTGRMVSAQIPQATGAGGTPTYTTTTFGPATQGGASGITAGSPNAGNTVAFSSGTNATDVQLTSVTDDGVTNGAHQSGVTYVFALNDSVTANADVAATAQVTDGFTVAVPTTDATPSMATVAVPSTPMQEGYAVAGGTGFAANSAGLVTAPAEGTSAALPWHGEPVAVAQAVTGVHVRVVSAKRAGGPGAEPDVQPDPEPAPDVEALRVMLAAPASLEPEPLARMRAATLAALDEFEATRTRVRAFAALSTTEPLGAWHAEATGYVVEAARLLGDMALAYESMLAEHSSSTEQAPEVHTGYKDLHEALGVRLIDRLRHLDDLAKGGATVTRAERGWHERARATLTAAAENDAGGAQASIAVEWAGEPHRLSWRAFAAHGEVTLDVTVEHTTDPAALVPLLGEFATQAGTLGFTKLTATIHSGPNTATVDFPAAQLPAPAPLVAAPGPTLAQQQAMFEQLIEKEHLNLAKVVALNVRRAPSAIVKPIPDKTSDTEQKAHVTPAVAKDVKWDDPALTVVKDIVRDPHDPAALAQFGELVEKIWELTESSNREHAIIEYYDRVSQQPQLAVIHGATNVIYPNESQFPNARVLLHTHPSNMSTGVSNEDMFALDRQGVSKAIIIETGVPPYTYARRGARPQPSLPPPAAPAGVRPMFTAAGNKPVPWKDGSGVQLAPAGTPTMRQTIEAKHPLKRAVRKALTHALRQFSIDPKAQGAKVAAAAAVAVPGAKQLWLKLYGDTGLIHHGKNFAFFTSSGKEYAVQAVPRSVDDAGRLARPPQEFWANRFVSMPVEVIVAETHRHALARVLDNVRTKLSDEDMRALWSAGVSTDPRHLRDEIDRLLPSLTEADLTAIYGAVYGPPAGIRDHLRTLVDAGYMTADTARDIATLVTAGADEPFVAALDVLVAVQKFKGGHAKDIKLAINPPQDAKAPPPPTVVAVLLKSGLPSEIAAALLGLRRAGVVSRLFAQRQITPEMVERVQRPRTNQHDVLADEVISILPAEWLRDALVSARKDVALFDSYVNWVASSVSRRLENPLPIAPPQELTNAGFRALTPKEWEVLQSEINKRRNLQLWSYGPGGALVYDPHVRSSSQHSNERCFDAEANFLGQLIRVLRELPQPPAGTVYLKASKPMCPSCFALAAGTIEAEFQGVKLLTFTDADDSMPGPQPAPALKWLNDGLDRAANGFRWRVDDPARRPQVKIEPLVSAPSAQTLGGQWFDDLGNRLGRVAESIESVSRGLLNHPDAMMEVERFADEVRDLAARLPGDETLALDTVARRLMAFDNRLAELAANGSAPASRLAPARHDLAAELVTLEQQAAGLPLTPPGWEPDEPVLAHNENAVPEPPRHTFEWLEAQFSFPVVNQLALHRLALETRLTIDVGMRDGRQFVAASYPDGRVLGGEPGPYQITAPVVPGGIHQIGPGGIHQTGPGGVQQIVPDPIKLLAYTQSFANADFLATLGLHNAQITVDPSTHNLTIRALVGSSTSLTTFVIMAADLSDRLRARTFVNASPMKDTHVIELNQWLHPAVVADTIRHEIREVLRIREQALDGQPPVHQDMLRPDVVPGPGAHLSADDLAHLAELNALADRMTGGSMIRRGRAIVQFMAMADELGLSERQQHWQDRRNAIAPYLSDEAKLRLDILAADHSKSELNAGLDREHTRIQKRAESQDDHGYARQVLFERPIATDQQGPLSATDLPTDEGLLTDQGWERLHEIALAARAARAEASRRTADWIESQPEPPVMRVMIGGGAALAGREPNVLLIDSRGRWQSDAGKVVAQTAAQLREVYRAGLGDPYQFALPNQRVPIDAVSFWEDTVAAQGPVLDGEATLRIKDGRLYADIAVQDGRKVTVAVEGIPVIATGFVPDRLPGMAASWSLHRSMTAIAQALEAKAANTPAAMTIHNAIGYRITLKKAKQIHDMLQESGITLSGVDEALRTLDAAAKFVVAQEKGAKAKRPLLSGMDANLGAIQGHDEVKKWFVAGVGGTSISAAEIILQTYSHAHVSMAGGSTPPGLLTNDQFVEVLANYGKQEVVYENGRHQLRNKADAKSNPKWRLEVVESPPGQGRINQPAALVRRDDETVGYDIKVTGIDEPFKVDGYVAGIGRDAQAPWIVEDLAQQASRNKQRVSGELLFDKDKRYIGYRISIDQPGGKAIEFDITGAASRWPTWYVRDAGRVRATGPIDITYAPGPSGNFGGGLGASAEEARLYALWRREWDPPPPLPPSLVDFLNLRNGKGHT